MKKTLITILLIVALLGVFLIFYQNRQLERKAPTTDQIMSQQAKQNWESKTDNQSAVTVTVTPIDISPEAKEWKFEVVMNTHSIELDQDLTKSVILIDDQGKEYKPINWNGPIGGHHRGGVLIFNQILPAPKYVEMKISGIGDVVRSFSWQLR